MGKKAAKAPAKPLVRRLAKMSAVFTESVAGAAGNSGGADGGIALAAAAAPVDVVVTVENRISKPMQDVRVLLRDIGAGAQKKISLGTIASNGNASSTVQFANGCDWAQATYYVNAQGDRAPMVLSSKTPSSKVRFQVKN